MNERGDELGGIRGDYIFVLDRANNVPALHDISTVHICNMYVYTYMYVYT